MKPLGKTDILVTPIAMGCWPIAGITSIETSWEAGVATLRAAFDAGINHFDTAWMYGYEGESERMIAEALGDVRDQIVIATKGGLNWGPPKPGGAKRDITPDGSPENIKAQCDQSLQRLNTDVIDLYYLHGPGSEIPLEETAGAYQELLGAGKIRAVGVSNFKQVEQYEAFSSVCEITADQQPFNMLQQQITDERLPWCLRHNVSVMVYWPLMKGLLAGKLARDHVWDPQDSRKNYALFQGESWTRAQDFLNQIRPIAAELECDLPEMVLAWTADQPGITVALAGAKRPEQIRQNAKALAITFSDTQREKIQSAIDAYHEARL